jgi:hypothetical protein
MSLLKFKSQLLSSVIQTAQKDYHYGSGDMRLFFLKNYQSAEYPHTEDL